MVGWLHMTINTEELDYAPVGGPAFELPRLPTERNCSPSLTKRRGISRSAFESKRAEIMKNWKLLAGGQEIFTMRAWPAFAVW